MEVQMHWFSIYCNLTTTWLNVNYSSWTLTLACTPCSALAIDLIRSLFFGQHSPEVEKINPVKLRKIVSIQIAFTIAMMNDVIISLVCKLWEEVSQMMLIEWILLHRMEQSYLCLFILGQRVDIILSFSVIKLNFSNDFLFNLLFSWFIIFQLLSIFNKIRFYWVERLNYVLLPIKVWSSLIPSSGIRCFKWMFFKIIVLSHVCFRIQNEFVKLETNIFQSCFFVHFG